MWLNGVKTTFFWFSCIRNKSSCHECTYYASVVLMLLSRIIGWNISKYMWMYFLRFAVFICDIEGLFLIDFSLQKKINKTIIKKHQLTTKIWWLIWSWHTFCTPKGQHFHLIFAIYVSNNKLSRNWGYLTKPLTKYVNTAFSWKWAK